MEKENKEIGGFMTKYRAVRNERIMRLTAELHKVMDAYDATNEEVKAILAGDLVARGKRIQES